MPYPTQVHIGKRVAKTPLTALNGFMALETMVDAARECFEVNQVERTRRAYIRGYREAEVRRIKGAEAILKKYFEQVFAERRENFSELFSRLDKALDQGNGEMFNVVLRGIVDIARTSPIADLGDLSQIRAALDDPNHVFEL